MQENIVSSQTIVITNDDIREEIRNVIRAQLVGAQMLNHATLQEEINRALTPLVQQATKDALRDAFRSLGNSWQW
jgi:hypothetical protein